MTFNVINDGDPVLAAPVMQNWRHVNYGSTLNPVDTTGSTTDGTLDFGSNSSHWRDAWFGDGTDVVFHVDAQTNNRVGVGTGTPSGKLEISASSDDVGSSFLILRDEDNTVGSRFPQIEFYGESSLLGRYGVADDGQGHFFKNSSGNDLVVFSDSGNVGINDTSPSNPLSVTGNIRGSADITADDDIVAVDEVRSGTNVRVGTDLYVDDGFIIFGTGNEKTISSGSITVDQTYHTVDTESNAASDDLESISGGTTNGTVIILRPVSTSRTVVVKHNFASTTNDIFLKSGSDYTMDDSTDTLALMRINHDVLGSIWVEI